MRKFFLFCVVVFLLGMGAKDFVRSGGLEKLLDGHSNLRIDPPLEYYWAELSMLATHRGSAEYRFRRVRDKYAGSSYSPLAWVGLIDLLDDEGRRNDVIAEGNSFLTKYPDHPKAELVRKKILFLQHGY